MTEQIKAMQKLGMTDTEIAEVLADDKKIDKGEKLFELPKELQQGAKKARMTGTKKPTVYNFTKREKKADRQKQFIIETISRALTDHLGGSVHEITNPEREIVIEYCHRKFKIVLSCPRSQRGQFCEPLIGGRQ